MNDTDPVILYLLMRTDLQSMNPGKACAQAHHAAAMMLGSAEDEVVQEWRMQAGLFGTVLTFGVDEKALYISVRTAHTLNLRAGLVLDPSYPVRDGQFTHKLALMTCGYVLARKSQVDFLANLQLMY